MAGEGMSDRRYTCSECHRPVSRHPDRAADRVPNADGGWDHAACHTPEMEMLAGLFGPPVRQISDNAVERLATNVGHVVTIDRRPGNESGTPTQGRAPCTCGWSTHWAARGSIVRLKFGHYRDVAVNG